MKQIGSFCFFILFCIVPIAGKSQCKAISDLVAVLDGNKSLDGYDFNYLDNIEIKGYEFPIQGKVYNFSNNDKLYVSKNKYCILVTSSACYRKIKSDVAKEQGARVGSKSILTFGNYNVEQYKHLNRDLIFEFHSNNSEDLLSIVLMNSETASLIDDFVVKSKEREEYQNIINDKLAEIRIALSAGNITLANKKLNSTKKTSNEYNLDELYNSEFKTLEKQIESKVFNTFKVEYDNYIFSQKFINARDLLNNYEFKASYKGFDRLQLNLTETAVNFYASKIEENELNRNYAKAILYSDSLLIFDPNNKSIKLKRKGLIETNDFLSERKTNTYDYWERNPEIRKNIINDYYDLSLSYINNNSGKVAFDIIISTDTNCNVKYDLIKLNSSTSSQINFIETEMDKYKLKPYKKFGLCANSEGRINFDLSWESTDKSVKIFDKSFKGSSYKNREIKDFISKTYPNTNGRFNFKELHVNFNGNENNYFTLNGFHTRGPQNAIFSLLLPGSGSLFVSYGKRYGPMGLFGLGITSLLTGNPIIAATCITISYFWDFISTLVIGTNNIIDSKSIRKALRGRKTIVLN